MRTLLPVYGWLLVCNRRRPTRASTCCCCSPCCNSSSSHCCNKYSFRGRFECICCWNRNGKKQLYSALRRSNNANASADFRRRAKGVATDVLPLSLSSQQAHGGNSLSMPLLAGSFNTSGSCTALRQCEPPSKPLLLELFGPPVCGCLSNMSLTGLSSHPSRKTCFCVLFSHWLFSLLPSPSASKAFCCRIDELKASGHS